MTDDDKRPSPDDLLSLATEEEKKTRHGKLKIFFGSSAGVGKTYSMLSAAQELLAQGAKVIVGIVETHGRPHTQELLDGLPVLPPLAIPYRGLLLKELDLDKALEIKPHTILVDELAHTNTPGARHPKRWNDVLELLDAGINVFTTLNVQHIESLSDIVASTTGVWVKETVPDSVFDMADDVVLVDIDTDDLLKRLHEGNVYIAPGANTRAADNFFRKDNLNALREIALRRTAERVDAERGQMHEMAGKSPISDKILVCVDPDADAARLIRAGKRIATALKASWTALYVERGDPHSRRNTDRRRGTEVLERMVSRLDGKMVTLHGNDLVATIIDYAQKHGVTKIMVGRDTRLTLRNTLQSFFFNRLIRASGNIDVIVITEDRSATAPPVRSGLGDLKPFNYLLAFVIAAVLSVPGLFMQNVLSGTDQALLYLTGVVIVAESMGLGPSLFYALMAASAFNIFFSGHQYFHASDERAYFITFIMMLVTGTAIARQSAALRAQALSSTERERKAQSLYELTRKLTGTRGRFPVSEVVCAALTKNFDVKAAVWMINQDNHPSIVLGDLPQDTYYKDVGALEWCFENGKNAGRGTSTMPSASGFYMPLTSATESLGVLGVFPLQNDRLFTFDDIAGMETLASLLASALSRVRAGEIAQQAMLDQESRRIQNDLRGNLGNAAPPITDDMTKSILPLEAQTYQKTVVPFEAVASGTNPHRLPSSISQCIDRSVALAHEELRQHTLILNVPSDLPDVLIDPPLIDQALVTFLINAAARSGPRTTIRLSASRRDDHIQLTIEDEGAALTTTISESHLFESYSSASRQDIDMTIAAGIIRLHQGRIWLENRAGGGVSLYLTLLIA